PRPTHSPDGVNFVDEEDAWGILFRSLEHIADAARAHTDEHLNELGARDRVEWHPRLAGHGPRHQRLARPRRADQQHALGHDGPQAHELLWRAQDLHDLL